MGVYISLRLKYSNNSSIYSTFSANIATLHEFYAAFAKNCIKFMQL